MKQNKVNSKNQRTLKYLIKQGYPLRAVRRAIVTLNELDLTTLARPLGVSRQCVSHYIYEGWRKNPDMQEAIAKMLDVDRVDYFVEQPK